MNKENINPVEESVAKTTISQALNKSGLYEKVKERKNMYRPIYGLSPGR